MPPTTPGFHHVSAIAGDPQGNVDFYTGVLGLHLVKRTVNFDDQFMYHLYYGDREGSPGSLFTCFPYMRGQEGRVGKPQPTAVAFAVPDGSLGYWRDRLRDRGVDVDEPRERFGERVLPFRDPDGLPLELVTADSPLPAAANGDVPAEHGLRGVHGVTLRSASVFHTARTLEVLGYDLAAQEGDRVRYRAPGGWTVVDLIDADAAFGREGIGTVHHVAVGAGGTPLETWREHLADAGLEPTWIKDRRYFRSVYAREPGGILFEVATAEPGLTVDEPRDALGSALRLPPWLAEDREMIERQLPPVTAGG